jgi:hypothetical protein
MLALALFDWMKEHDTLLWWLGIGSAVMFVATLIAVPWMVTKIPPDYFVRKKRPESAFKHHHPALRVLIAVAKNLLGVIILLAGIAMIVLPGQGVLTIAVGLMLIDFPGKFRFERWLVRKESVQKAVNWLRKKAKAPPLEVPPKNGGDEKEANVARSGA